MRRSAAFLLALTTGLAGCSGEPCAPVEVPAAMDGARARALAPEVETGIAVSTTLVVGDCRPVAAADPDTCEADRNPACSQGRAPLTVFVVPDDLSLVRAPACAPGFATDELAARAAARAEASEEGEAVLAVPPGRYRLFIAEPDARCGACGLEEAPDLCLSDVVDGTVTVRDLVLDRARH